MRDIGKISAGLIVFLCIITSPIWYTLAMGKKAAEKPDPKLPVQDKQCVAPRDTMIATHMSLLNQWRDKAVREGDRGYVAKDGKTYLISLSDGCMKCHSSKVEFCDACHNYVDVTPYCWDCHVEPKENK